MGKDFRTQREEVRNRARGLKSFEELQHDKRVEAQRAKLREEQERKDRKAEQLGPNLFEGGE